MKDVSIQDYIQRLVLAPLYARLDEVESWATKLPAQACPQSWAIQRNVTKQFTDMRQLQRGP